MPSQCILYAHVIKRMVTVNMFEAFTQDAFEWHNQKRLAEQWLVTFTTPSSTADVIWNKCLTVSSHSQTDDNIKAVLQDSFYQISLSTMYNLVVMFSVMCKGGAPWRRHTKNMVALGEHKKGDMKPSTSLSCLSPPPYSFLHRVSTPLCFFYFLCLTIPMGLSAKTQKRVEGSQSLSGARMRIVLQRVRICDAQVILKVVVGGWLWDRVRKSFEKKGGARKYFANLRKYFATFEGG